MTEAEWLVCKEPQTMIEFLQGKSPTARKWRLFALAFCSRYRSRMQDETSHQAVEVAERRADGLASPDELAAASHAAHCAANAYHAHLAGDPPDEFPVADAISFPTSASDRDIANAAAAAAEVALAASAPEDDNGDWATAGAVECSKQCLDLRCIFGPLPFRSVTNGTWLTSTVVTLVRAIYDERAFHRLPLLADALEDTGCTNADILTHCRQPGDHVRGCWVVDLLLNRK